jgi:hypothetical protein|tara:strand:+ start:1200 stop:1373 length:174 start_codon:yes stop_codon:yes gene_type:complete
MMEHDYKLYEEYGYKSHSLGLFDEWRNITSSIISNNPKIDKGEAAEQAFSQLVGSKK